MPLANTPSAEIGELRHRVAMYAPVGPQNTQPSGQTRPTWLLMNHIHATIEPIGGGKLWYGSQLHAEATHLVLVRYRFELHEKGVGWVLRHKGRDLAILSVMDIHERRKFLLLQCKEQIAPEPVS